MPERLFRKERWPTTTSAAVLIHNNDGFRSLILVRKKDTRQWGLIAGGLLEGETVEQAMYRELLDEAGFDQEDVGILGRPEVLTIEQEHKTSIGLLFIIGVKSSLPKDGYKMESDETDLVRPFSHEELRELLTTPEKIYKPDFNIPAIKRWFDYAREF